MRYIVLNRSGEESLFRKALHEVLNTNGDRIILGYGYLKEDIAKRNDFIQCLKQGFASSDKKEIIIVGNNQENYSSFIKSAKHISKEIPEADIQVLIKKVNKHGLRQYHKKLAIKTRGGHAVLSLLGSSNLSSATYDDGPYNQEVDILLWNSFIVDEISEEKLLNNVKKSTYLEKFKGLRKLDSFLQSFKIDLDLDFELEDIIEEVNCYSSRDFEIKFISANSIADVTQYELKGIIDSTTDMDVIKEVLLYLYNYTRKNLHTPSNVMYFNDNCEAYKQMINKRDKTSIKYAINTCTGHLRNTLIYNKIKGDTVNLFQNLLNLL